MNPLFLFEIIFGTMLHFKRICPECKRNQVTPPSKRLESVRCKFCGAEVPPRKNPYKK